MLILTALKMAADKSSEADILTFIFNNDMVIGEPIIDGTDISFMISDDMTNEQLSTLVLHLRFHKVRLWISKVELNKTSRNRLFTP